MTDFGRYIAHRGLHGEAVPENSMAAFETAAQKGLAVELDVRLTKDGKLVVLHDSSLMRVCGVEGEVRDFTAEQLGAFRLNGSGEGIPMFREVLKRINGRVPLLIEIKNCDHGSIEPRVRRILKSYKGSYAVQAFDPRTVLWFRLFAPSVCRGQLISTRRFGSFWEYIARVISASPIVWKYITKPDFTHCALKVWLLIFKTRCRNLLGFARCIVAENGHNGAKARQIKVEFLGILSKPVVIVINVCNALNTVADEFTLISAFIIFHKNTPQMFINYTLLQEILIVKHKCEKIVNLQ